MEKSVTLKGTNDGYFLFLDDTSSLSNIYRDLEELFNQIKKDDQYEQEFDLTIDTGNRLFNDKSKVKLTDFIKEHSNFAVKHFKEHVIDKELAETWHKETSPWMVVKNVRNGQIVRSDRDIILIGDIRPGGLVQSAGSVLVVGNVQGTIHAGAKGNDDAIIVASFSFDGQVRIGEHVEFIEIDGEESSEKDDGADMKHQIVFLNDLHIIEFADTSELGKIRPDFARDLGGFEEWQKQL